MTMDETAFPTNANQQIADLRQELDAERVRLGQLSRDVEMVTSAAGTDLFGVAEELHRLHKMIHKLRDECVSELSDEEIDDRAGVEPQCATCHGFGSSSGQAPIPVELAVHDTTHAELLTPDKLAQVDKALRGVGLKLLYKVEEES